MKSFLLLLCCVCTLSIYSQDIERTTIDGRIVVASNDKEGVTVFNTSSNKGAITDENGTFEIAVALNDVIEFGALQFKDFSVTITNEVLESKQLTVLLVEEVNKLDEVVLLPFGLTGNLDADLENVRTYNVSLDAVYFGLDHIEDFEFTSDYKTKVDNLAFNEYNPHMENMLNLVNVAGFLMKQIINIDGVSLDNIKFKSEKEKQLIEKTPFKQALDTYSVNYIHTNFDIPLNQIEAFTDYVEKQGVDETLFEENKELQLLERISQLSKSFLKTISDQD
ncbi:carboxypeptidase-like regulatory domain-containing protein [uncultured Winogradskyella sp.]|uniref:carboxypeptidase-like regulatory domain-containing protein n=1 Tax=uncultured Winogradskyella sp. TaxID=395353 RepID=UPI00262C2C3A|nr:carboxypeptidase-like regulatory domain-containing protein [uncultured Winogradskyella sp.]|tara:strand:- start:604 stop:1440 length:837 start_codon:yes stop_codon:yes gene_type:complete